MYESTDFVPTPNVGIFSLIGTLVVRQKTKWAYACSDVPEKLRLIASRGCVVVIENSYSKKYLNIAKKAFEWLVDDLQVPMLGLFPLATRYRKPYTHIWSVLERKLGEIDKGTSLICGNMAGRIRGSYPADYLDYDRAFASNVEVQFVTNRLFNSIPERKWEWNRRLISFEQRQAYLAADESSEPDLISVIGEMAESSMYLIIVMGPPASGKSLLGRRIAADWEQQMGSSLALMNTKHSMAKLDEKFDARESVLLEGRLGKAYQRRKYINKAAEYGAPILIVNLTTPRELCMLLYHISVQTTPVNKKAAGRPTDTYFRSLNNPHDDLHKGEVNTAQLRCVDYPMVVRERHEYWLRY
jgi:hypothetical protein